MTNLQKKIGISGGTFDPIHYGHLIISEEARISCNLDKVIFIPSGMPPHKNLKQVTYAKHRLKMIKLAISDNPYFEVSDIEIERLGHTYTVDTLNILKNIYDDNTKFYYIIGADVVHSLLKWKSIEEVFSLCEFIAVLRPGFDNTSMLMQIDNLKTKYNAIIHVVNIPLIDISSTDLRNNIKNRGTIRYYVPDSVEKYILQNKLYV